MLDREHTLEFNPRRASPLALVTHALWLERSGDPQSALEILLDRIGGGVKARPVLRAASNLAATYADFDVLPLSEPGLLRLLNDPTVDRAPLSRIAMFKAMSRWPLINIIGAGETGHWDTAARMFLNAVEEIADDALFITALETDPIQAFSLESLLIAVRAELLREPAQLDDDPAMRIALAMIRQVDLNEGVWSQDKSEIAMLKKLPLNDANLALHALYGGYATIDELSATSIVHVDLRKWVENQRCAVARLQEATATIPSNSVITDDISLKVGAQYAEFPYPRWTSLSVPNGGDHLAMVRALSSDNRLHGAKRPDVLIAGCGTGQHAIASALGYGGKARVLGIDLSRASLAYAATMAEAFAVRNLSLVQSDLLEIDALDRSFDIIESIGVLHHTADPLKSWETLLGALKPGGLMTVGLYSATARAGLSQFRAALEQGGAPLDDNAVKILRRNMIQSPRDDFERAIVQSADFNTTSNLRDLLFNVHEIPLSLTEIRDFIGQQGLRFLRFDAPPVINARFIERHGQDARGDLDAWIDFEAENPDAFEGMYVFWVQA
jgi:SAM-dependent methyltransferase